MTIALLLSTFQQAYLIHTYIKKVVYASHEVQKSEKREPDQFDTEFEENTKVDEVLIQKESYAADLLVSVNS